MSQTQTLFLNRTLLSRQTQRFPHPGKGPSSTTTPVELALSIPEILEHILSFLSPKERRGVARFVCKRWYSVCKGFIAPIPFIWPLCLSDEANQTAKGLVHLARSLTIRVSQPQHTLDRIASWAEMMGTLSTLICEHSLPRLRSLYLMDGVLENPTIQLPQLPRLTFLTTLRIERNARWDLMYLFPILKACPNLKELVIKPGKETRLQGDSLSSIMSPSQEDNLINGDTLPTTRLRTCVFYNMMITLPALGVFLGACPGLSELILIRSYCFARSGNHAFEVRHRALFIDLVASHCLDLRNFHFSSDSYNLDSREVTRILEHFPDLEEYSFSDLDAGATLLTGLRTIVNRVTTLNLVTIHPHGQGISPLISLREILCSFEHLVHLRAPSLQYHHSDFDINGINTQGCSSNWNRPDLHVIKGVPLNHYIWVCHGLQTLHMAIEHHSSGSGTPVDALIMFGFLSRMCPQLQELYLSRSTLDLSFPGGFCLLTRFQELERLKITTVYDHYLDEHALDWIRPEPSARDRLVYPILRRKARQDLKPYYRLLPEWYLEGEKYRKKERAAKAGIDTSNVGYTEDLMKWMDDRYRGRLQPTWPKLESFWIGSRRRTRDKSLEKLEAFVRKARPDVDFQLSCPQRDAYLTTLQLY